MKRDDLFRLFGGFSDGTLSDAEMEQLQTALRESAEARRLWFLFNDVEAGLASVHAASTVVPPRRRATWWVVAAAAAAMIVAGLFLFSQRGTVPVAVLSAATNVRWSDPNVELMLRGGELPHGPLHLEVGVAEFSFSGGATALIEGPAVFELVAADKLVLRTGRVIGRCAKPEAKLTIVTPGTVVTDLGTEFGVAVGDDRQTRVAVIKGVVELGAGQHSQRLNAGEAMAVDERGQMAKAEFVIAEFSRMAEVFPAEDVSVRDGINRLQDPGMTSSLWNGTAGHVDRTAAGLARIRAKGNPLWPLLWQDVPAREIAGRAVVASIRAMQPDDDPLSGLQNAIIKMMFLDEAGREFARAERHFLRSSAPRGQWIHGQIAAVAPAGTARIQFQVLLNARGLKSGSLLFTDPSLVVLEAP